MKVDSPNWGMRAKIVDLSHRLDHILEVPKLDLEALAILAADYKAAHMPFAATDWRRMIEYYQEV